MEKEFFKFNNTAINSIKDVLIKKELTLAVAESVTGGFLQAALTQAGNASAFFHGGITAYNLGQKARHLHINTISAEKYNCVSKNVSEEMALSVTKMFGSDYGIAITGYASPLPEMGILKLYAHVAYSYRDRIIMSRKINATNIKEGMAAQLFYTNKILTAFDNLLKIKR